MQAKIEFVREQLKHISDPCNYMPLSASFTPTFTAGAPGGAAPGGVGNQSSNNTITTPASVYTCSLFEDNYLYPQLDYRVDLSKVSAAINDLSVQIGRHILNASILNNNNNNNIINTTTNTTTTTTTTNDQDQVSPSRLAALQLSSSPTPVPAAAARIPKFESELESDVIMDGIVSTGVLYDGVFWLQPATKSANEFELLESAHKLRRVQMRVNLYLDEVSKHVRRKLIGDETWQTYAELNEKPQSE